MWSTVIQVNYRFTNLRTKGQNDISGHSWIADNTLNLGWKWLLFSFGWHWRSVHCPRNVEGFIVLLKDTLGSWYLLLSPQAWTLLKDLWGHLPQASTSLAPSLLCLCHQHLDTILHCSCYQPYTVNKSIVLISTSLVSLFAYACG